MVLLLKLESWRATNALAGERRHGRLVRDVSRQQGPLGQCVLHVQIISFTKESQVDGCADLQLRQGGDDIFGSGQRRAVQLGDDVAAEEVFVTGDCQLQLPAAQVNLLGRAAWLHDLNQEADLQRDAE